MASKLHENCIGKVLPAAMHRMWKIKLFWMGGWVAGWQEQLKLRLSQLSTKLKLKLKLKLSLAKNVYDRKDNCIAKLTQYINRVTMTKIIYIIWGRLKRGGY